MKGGEDEEFDEELEWINELEEAGGHSGTYFTKVNETREVMKAGS